MARSYWRLKAIEAVNYTCQICGGRKSYEELEIHHVDPFHLIVVCKNCHRKKLRKDQPRSKNIESKPRQICPRCGKPGIPRIHTTIVYYGQKKYVYRYNAFEHPEENKWCNLGRYVSKKIENAKQNV
jgi:NAD-dependent SIR2 family protein deacetylase